MLYFSGGNALKETQDSAVRTGDSCGWISNTQAFLATGSEPAGGDSALFSERED